jgi:hypothetical protein
VLLLSGGAANAATCPNSGAACLYHSANFNDDYYVYYPNTGYRKTSGLLSVRNRTSYALCIIDLDKSNLWIQIGPGGWDSNLNLIPWYYYTDKVELYFHNGNFP